MPPRFRRQPHILYPSQNNSDTFDENFDGNSEDGDVVQQTSSPSKPLLSWVSWGFARGVYGITGRAAMEADAFLRGFALPPRGGMLG